MRTESYFNREKLEWAITIYPENVLEESLFLAAHDAKIEPTLTVSEKNCFSSIVVRVPVTKKK